MTSGRTIVVVILIVALLVIIIVIAIIMMMITALVIPLARHWNVMMFSVCFCETDRFVVFWFDFCCLSLFVCCLLLINQFPPTPRLNMLW